MKKCNLLRCHVTRNQWQYIHDLLFSIDKVERLSVPQSIFAMPERFCFHRISTGLFLNGFEGDHGPRNGHEWNRAVNNKSYGEPQW